VEKERLYWEDEEPKKSRRERRLERQRRRIKKRRAGFTELVLTIVVAFVLVFGFVRPFVVEAYRIPTESMVPTLQVGDRVLANKFIYHFREPHRGDIVVFDSVDEEDDQTLIKRVVGLAGDEIQVQGGVLYVNGEAQKEPYLNQDEPFRGSYGPTEVPEGHIFVMGDNRGNSADSRVFGPLPLENLQGEAVVRFWPLSKIGAL
jgi:signal peptidase I